MLQRLRRAFETALVQPQPAQVGPGGVQACIDAHRGLQVDRGFHRAAGLEQQVAQELKGLGVGRVGPHRRLAGLQGLGRFVLLLPQQRQLVVAVGQPGVLGHGRLQRGPGRVALAGQQVQQALLPVDQGAVRRQAAQAGDGTLRIGLAAACQRHLAQRERCVGVSRVGL